MKRLLDTAAQPRLIDVIELGGGKGSHAHVAPRPFHALSFRIKGNGSIGDGARKLSLCDGLLLFIPAHTPYELHSGTERLVVVHFTLDCEISCGLAALDTKKDPAICEIFLRLLDIWQAKGVGFELDAMAELYRLLGRVKRLSSELDGRREYAKIQPVLHYIHKNFKDPALDLGALCACAGLGETQLRKCFLEACGTTPLRYINEYRVNYAAALLDSGSTRIEEVALACGFADPKYFSTVFKKYKGLSPSAYQKRTPLPRDLKKGL